MVTRGSSFQAYYANSSVIEEDVYFSSPAVKYKLLKKFEKATVSLFDENKQEKAYELHIELLDKLDKANDKNVFKAIESFLESFSVDELEVIYKKTKTSFKQAKKIYTSNVFCTVLPVAQQERFVQERRGPFYTKSKKQKQIYLRRHEEAEKKLKALLSTRYTF